ncbi:hypothetical protein SD77_2413 [Bacillus badius]|uniref:Uncharacterized protein n=1 Tax=Bacillus badius TaxID=1455 RepID=A0ABR5AZ56_BACBA|nr:hypothetical protein SD78_2128 [Bacillus badius]KIL79959.1 hypothetical protein SD77_2413 [Bacillus badius]
MYTEIFSCSSILFLCARSFEFTRGLRQHYNETADLFAMANESAMNRMSALLMEQALFF